MAGNEVATGFWPAFSYPALSPAVSRLTFTYFFIILVYAVSRYLWLRPKSTMTRSFADGLVVLNLVGFTLWSIVYAKAIAVTSISPASKTTTSWRSIFTVPAESNNGANLIPNILDPEAIDPQSVCPGYRGSNVKTTQYGITADLTIAGKACNVYGTDIDNLVLTVEHQSNTRLHIEITPKYIGAANSTWFILPEVLIPKPSIEGRGRARVASDLDFAWSNTPTFSFTVTRHSTGDVLFTTKGTKLVFENQFIEIGTPLPENYNLYGLGEAMHGFRMGNNFTRSFWAADAGDPIDGNIYSNHPFYLDTRYFKVDPKTTKLTYVANATDASATYKSYSHGVYFRNAHALEALMRPTNFTWRALGGNIDMYIYAGPTQKQITEEYQLSAVGLPAMQQYFTLGYHQCRWGYKNWTQLQEVVDNFKKFQIPLDTIWTDIDYMNQYRDFENDQNTFPYPEGAKFLSNLHANGQHYVPIVDSAVYIPNPSNASDAYPTFDRGNDADSFMLNPDGSLYIGAVWPGYTVFPDFIASAFGKGGAEKWWIDELTRWNKDVSFDGIWIDMNEVSSFCVGSCGSKNLTLNPVHPFFQLPGEPGNDNYDYPEGFESTNGTEFSSISSVSSSVAASKSSAAGPPPTVTVTTPYLRSTPTPNVRNVNHPPYVINNIQGDLAVHAVSPNATHHGGGEEYDFHNLFGHQILNATYNALLNIAPTKRPFIIGRSTFAGTGKWAGHWGGDNASKFLYMALSIPQALSFSLFGIPMFGVDTCGFNGNADEELCNRWMQLSAFFTFYRNHNVLASIPQEPYRWASVIDASKKAMHIRYLLLPYIYTTYYLSHSTGSTTMRALAWEFPDDPTLANADRQFLLGDALMVAPVLTQGATSVGAVFPGVKDGEIWYDWYTQAAVSAKPGENITIPAPLGHIPVYIRGGAVLPTQEPGLTTKASREGDWGLIVALSQARSAKGQLYVDDGQSLKVKESLWVDLETSASCLTATPKGNFVDRHPLANVTILGLQQAPKHVYFNNKVVSGGWSYNSTSKVLKVGGLAKVTARGAWKGKWEMSWK